MRSEVKSRRGFLRDMGLGGAGLVLSPVLVRADAPAPAWSRELDVLVVGSGAAGLSAALFARAAGASVAILEKGPAPGGTTARSGGVHFIPNNHLLRAQGKGESREDFLRFIVRATYPERYHPELPNFGAEAADFELLGAFYDQAAPTIDALEAMDAVTYMSMQEADGQLFPDNFVELPENTCPRGRALVCVPETIESGRFYYPGGGGLGIDLVARLRQALAQQRVPVLTRHAATRLVTNAQRQVIGVVAVTKSGEVWLRAKRGVVFGSGGYLHNPTLRRRYLRGPVYGGCGVPTNRGDFLRMAAGVGAALGNLGNGWWMEVLLEEAIASSDTPTGIWVLPGDSSLFVDRYGRRFCDEKNQPGGRPQHHFEWDPVRVAYPRLVTVMIWDRRAVDLFGGTYGIQPKQGALPKHVIVGKDLSDLATSVGARLDSLAEHTGGFRLDESFAQNLPATIARFNEFARTGKDEDFQRGEAKGDVAWHFYGGVPKVANPYPNPLLHPLSAEGPYYAALVVAGAIDSKGGPRVDTSARVLDMEGRPIEGLYGAGNCVAHLSAGAYWGGGATIGPAVVFGRIAGEHAARAALKQDLVA